MYFEWVPWFSAGVKPQRSEANHLLPSSAEVKNERSGTYTAICLPDVDRGNFAVY
jgi:hypothetical protein